MAGSEPSPSPRALPFRLERPLGWLRPPDVPFLAYLAVSGAVLAAGAARGLPRCAEQLRADAVVLAAFVLVAALARGSRLHVFAVLRLAYIPILYTFLYRQIEVLWPVFHDAPFDAAIAALDQRLFGFQPSLAFQAAFPSRAVGELFCFSYYAYYYYTPVLLVIAALSHGYRAAERIVFAVTLCFACCYVFFWLVPVVGPHFWFPPHTGPTPYPGYLFAKLLYVFTGRWEIRGAAFPSSHVAVALMLTLHSRRVAPRLFPVFAAITTVMAFAVVYLRAHYAVDVVPGLLVGLAFYVIGNLAFDRLALERIN